MDLSGAAARDAVGAGAVSASAAGGAAGGVVGVGIDLVSIERFAASLVRTAGLADRLFTPGERTTVTGRSRSAASLAARFAAKEAVAKALGAPRGMEWHDCVVVSDASGRPELRVTGTVQAEAVRQGIRHWRISLTHDGGMAAAMVVALA